MKTGSRGRFPAAAALAAVAVAAGAAGARPEPPGSAPAPASGPAAGAIPVLRFDGQVRYRGLADDRDFDRGSDPTQWAELRTRLGLLAEPQPGLQLYLQAQDSRVLGANSGGTGAAADDEGLGMHQGYLRYEPGGRLGLQAGRFQLAFGNERLVGRVDWDNVGRTWDGVRLSHAGAGHRIDLFAVKRSESVALRAALPETLAAALGDGDRDHHFLGANWRLAKTAVELFAYADLDRTPRVVGLEGEPGRPALEADRHDLRLTVGASAARPLGPRLDLILDAALQLGRARVRLLPDGPEREQDIGAGLLFLEAGYTLPGAAGLRAALMVDYASGDDDPLDDEIGTFDNLYYTGHKFRGFMDYFVPSRAPGLVDSAFRLRARPREAWTLRLDLHHFAAAADYLAADGSRSRELGQEIDLVGVFQDGRFTLEGGAGVFHAAGKAGGYAPALAGRDDTALWSYVMLTAGF